MKLISQLLVVFTVCLAGAGASALIPFPFPASVASMLLLFLLLFLRILRPEQLRTLTVFLQQNMALFFIPATVGIVELYEELRGAWLALIFICVISTVLTFAATAWTVCGVMRLQERQRQKRGIQRETQ